MSLPSGRLGGGSEPSGEKVSRDDGAGVFGADLAVDCKLCSEALASGASD